MISTLEKGRSFVSYQRSVNGDNIGVPNLRGSIDVRIGDSIIEIKSSENDIPQIDELLYGNPQDLK
ncbi:MAG: hypothetical protein QXZ17_12085 [Nitrososphaerota archaeon]